LLCPFCVAIAQQPLRSGGSRSPLPSEDRARGSARDGTLAQGSLAAAQSALHRERIKINVKKKSIQKRSYTTNSQQLLINNKFNTRSLDTLFSINSLSKFKYSHQGAVER
jgi:hypothetical protein